MRNSQSQRLTRKLNLLIEEMGLVDIWRHFNSTVRNYTYYSSPHETYSRIDYFLSFGTDMNKIQECHIGSVDVSDHCPLYLSVNLTQRRKIINWKLNSSILNESTCEQLTKDIVEYLEFNDKDELPPPILWDACKAVMRGKIIAITSNIKKFKVARLQKLQSELLQLEATHKNTIDTKTKSEMAKKRNLIDEIYTQDVQTKIMLTKQRYYEGGAKYMKQLAYRLRKQQADRTIYRIRDPETKMEMQGTEEIKYCFKR